MNVFNASILTCCDAELAFKLVIDVLTLALLEFRFDIEVAKELVVEFKFVIDTLTLADVLSKLFNLIFVD